MTERGACIELGDRPVRMQLLSHPEHGLVVLETIDEKFSDHHPDVAALVDRLMWAKHPNVARVHRVDRTTHGGIAVTSEYIEGETLADLVRDSNGALSLEIRLRVLVDVLAGLSSLHADDIAIGTLTSSSIVVGSDDGVARITGVPRAPLGARAMSSRERSIAPPEIDLGHDASIASDVFAIGVILWEALARRPIGDPRGAPAPACAHAWAAPLCELAARALSIDPAARPANASEMAASIRMVTRSKLASRETVLGAIAEFGMEHVLARRARFARSSTELLDVLTPFEIATSPRGRTISAHLERDSQLETTEVISPPVVEYLVTPPATEVPPREEGTGEQIVHELAPRPSYASTGEHVLPPAPRLWTRYAIGMGATACAIGALAIFLFVRRAPEVAHDAPAVPELRSPGAATQSVAIAAPSPPPSLPPSAPSATAKRPIPIAPAKSQTPTKKPPLRPSKTYDPTSI